MDVKVTATLSCADPEATPRHRGCCIVLHQVSHRDARSAGSMAERLTTI